LIDPAQFDSLLAYLRRQRLLPYAALERHEVAEFERRFQIEPVDQSVPSRSLLLPPDDAVRFVPLERATK
jgi:hypothetical protein